MRWAGYCRVLVCIHGKGHTVFSSSQTGSSPWVSNIYKDIPRKLITPVYQYRHSGFHSDLYSQVPQLAENILKYWKALLENCSIDPSLISTKWTKTQQQALTREIQLCPAVCWNLTYFPEISFATKRSVQISNNFRTEVSILIVEGIKRKGCSQSRRELLSP